MMLYAECATIDELFSLAASYIDKQNKEQEKSVIAYLVVNYPKVVLKVLKLVTNKPTRHDFNIISIASEIVDSKTFKDLRDSKSYKITDWDDCNMILNFYKKRN